MGVVLIFRANRKPGSVYDNYLSRIYISAYLKPPSDGRASHMSYLGVASDGVYTPVRSPGPR